MLHWPSATLDELHRLIVAWWGAPPASPTSTSSPGSGNPRAALKIGGDLPRHLDPPRPAAGGGHRRPRPGLKAVNDGQGHDAGDERLRPGRRLPLRAPRRGTRLPDRRRRVPRAPPGDDPADAEVLMARVQDAGAPSFSYGTAEAPRRPVGPTTSCGSPTSACSSGAGRPGTAQRPRARRRQPRRPRPSAPPRPRRRRRCALALTASPRHPDRRRRLDLADAIERRPLDRDPRALPAAAAQSGAPALPSTLLAPLLGMAAASAAAPLLDADTRPASASSTCQPTAGSSGRRRPAAVAEVPTGPSPPAVAGDQPRRPRPSAVGPPPARRGAAPAPGRRPRPRRPPPHHDLHADHDIDDHRPARASTTVPPPTRTTAPATRPAAGPYLAAAGARRRRRPPPSTTLWSSRPRTAPAGGWPPLDRRRLPASTRAGAGRAAAASRPRPRRARTEPHGRDAAGHGTVERRRARPSGAGARPRPRRPATAAPGRGGGSGCSPVERLAGGSSRISLELRPAAARARPRAR